ncbi:MAG: hypothetical protein VYA34_16470 [Myxococcota bacterium]|nr:hypothetical protein [Myxococcota bacterium]
MHRQQNMVRFVRLGSGYRDMAGLLGMGANTERFYREALPTGG